MVDIDRLMAAYETAHCDLLAECDAAGRWVGELAGSPLATAAAISALALVERHAPTGSNGRFADEVRECHLSGQLMRSIHWLARQQNADGGWGDTDKSLSNIATTLLARAAFQLTGVPAEHASLLESADAYIARGGGMRALRRRAAGDKTFAAPILANLALAELVAWRDVPSLPFERAALPERFWRRARLPVASHAIPALVAVGQLKFHFVRPWNPLLRYLRKRTLQRTLALLAAGQPASGGYLEAVPLTSFVVMSLAGMNRADHPVAVRGAQFLLNFVRPDGSWPLEANLAVRNTTLSICALAAAGEDVSRLACLDWLLGCQGRAIHASTGAAPGAWARTDLAGGAPNAIDTAGALLALSPGRNAFVQRLPGTAPTGDSRGDAMGDSDSIAFAPIARAAAEQIEDSPADMAARANLGERITIAARRGVGWLADLQNVDGGWPTFSRGWDRLPLDRSGADPTAQALRALGAWRETLLAGEDASRGERHLLASRLTGVIARGFNYLRRAQRPAGAWTSLCFGNQHLPDESNPVCGTASVLLAFSELGAWDDPAATAGLDWLVAAQNADGGWGARANPRGARSAAGGAANHGGNANNHGNGQHASNGQPAPVGDLIDVGAFFRKVRPAKRLVAGGAGGASAGSTVEETSAAVEALLGRLAAGGSGLPRNEAYDAAATRGVDWLVDAVEANRHGDASPIGFYFARIWYYERLFPLIMTVAALGSAARQRQPRVAPRPAMNSAKSSKIHSAMSFTSAESAPEKR